MAGQGPGMRQGSFERGGFRIFYTRKKIKLLRLRLVSGQWRLSIPTSCDPEAVEGFLARHEDWMSGAYERYLATAPSEDELEFLGKKYRIKIDENINKTTMSKETITCQNKVELESFLRKNASIIFKFYLKKWQRITGLKHSHLSIKNMRTRWGSCNHKKAYINLNLRLLHKPLRAIEYVILHELAHLLYRRHDRDFYGFLFAYMPDFARREREYFGLRVRHHF